MDLFKKEEKGKEILNGGKTVKLRLKSNGKYTVEVDDIAVKVTQRGFMNAVNRGFPGTKTFPFSNITAIQFKEPGFTTGYLQFILSGSLETKRGVSGAVRDENSILFTKKELALMSELKEYVEWKILNKHQANTVNSNNSEADEILKFKSLLDQGIITEDEFAIKKKQILGL